jgi:hypothetical protein
MTNTNETFKFIAMKGWSNNAGREVIMGYSLASDRRQCIGNIRKTSSTELLASRADFDKWTGKSDCDCCGHIRFFGPTRNAVAAKIGAQHG